MCIRLTQVTSLLYPLSSAKISKKPLPTNGFHSHPGVGTQLPKHFHTHNPVPGVKRDSIEISNRVSSVVLCPLGLAGGTADRKELLIS